jgi:hypothetical protein
LTCDLLPDSITCTEMPSAEKNKWTAVSKGEKWEILMKTAVGDELLPSSVASGIHI